MRMFRFLAVLAIGLALFGGITGFMQLNSVSATIVYDGTLPYTGQGFPISEPNGGCDVEVGYSQFNFTAGGNHSVTLAHLTVNGVLYTNFTLTGGVFKFITPYYDVLPTASVSYVGSLGNGNPNLTISHGCPNADPTETPTSTPTDVPTETPTDVPTETPTVTNTPTCEETQSCETPTETPTDVPTETPTDVPTETPTDVPTETVTVVPTLTVITDELCDMHPERCVTPTVVIEVEELPDTGAGSVQTASNDTAALLSILALFGALVAGLGALAYRRAS